LDLRTNRVVCCELASILFYIKMLLIQYNFKNLATLYLPSDNDDDDDARLINLSCSLFLSKHPLLSLAISRSTLSSLFLVVYIRV
jgi:hypothetical protein